MVLHGSVPVGLGCPGGRLHFYSQLLLFGNRQYFCCLEFVMRRIVVRKSNMTPESLLSRLAIPRLKARGTLILMKWHSTVTLPYLGYGYILSELCYTALEWRPKYLNVICHAQSSWRQGCVSVQHERNSI